MMTPSPNAGCSTSSPMWSPSSCAFDGCGVGSSPGRERGVDDPFAVRVARSVVVVGRDAATAIRRRIAAIDAAAVVALGDSSGGRTTSGR